MGKVIALGQITQEIVDSWLEKYDKRDDAFYCKECGSQIMQCTCYVSMHLKLFEPVCAGPGEVKTINYPYCLKCDGEIEYAQACFHVRAMNYEFRVVPHSMLLGKQMVEFWMAGQFVAGIYPHQDGIRVVSKYMTGVSKVRALPPAAIIFLGKKPVEGEI